MPLNCLILSSHPDLWLTKSPNHIWSSSYRISSFGFTESGPGAHPTLPCRAPASPAGEPHRRRGWRWWETDKVSLRRHRFHLVHRGWGVCPCDPVCPCSLPLHVQFSNSPSQVPPLFTKIDFRSNTRYESYSPAWLYQIPQLCKV